MHLVSISQAQRAPLPHARWLGTVYHGLPTGMYRFHPKPADYLAFLGLVSPEKRPDRAIEIAIRAGLPLKIAVKIDPVDRDYFNAVIRPLLSHPLVEFLGEIDEREKENLLGHAKALLFPIDWPEPFGLVMIEALACGTPVIAFRKGSVPEVIEHGVTGFVVETVDEAVDAVRRLDALSPRRCREEFEKRFTSTRMAADYVKIYEKLTSPCRRPPGLRIGPAHGANNLQSV